MLSLFKKKPAPDEPLTLKTRVELFWKWYAEVAPRFYKMIDERKAPALAPEVSAKIDELFPGFAWVFGPGKDNVGHSFTLSGEGILHRQLISLYWLSLAPVLPGWTFYASRQPGSVAGMTMDIGERKFDPIEFWITPEIENEHINITAWHPLFDVLEERDRWSILYLFLDEVFGEYGTEQFIGKISFNDKRLAEAIPITELLKFAQDAKEKAGWEKYPPGECYTGYSSKDSHDRFLRGDIIAGTTSQFMLVQEYGDAEGELKDPLAGMGADYVFVSFPASFLPQGKEVEARSGIEDVLSDALISAQSGRLLGGAYGTKNAYIDLMLFDGKNSLEIVQKVLREKKLPSGTEIHFFAKEKRGHRIVL